MNPDDYLSFDLGFSYLTGVSDIQPRVMRYMMRPHSLISPDFWRYYNETVSMMKKFMHTKADLIPMVGPGRVVMDGAINSFLEPGEKAVFIDNGYWGRFPADHLAPQYGVTPILSTHDGRRPIDVDAVEKTLKKEKDVKAVHMIHVETEVGAINPVKQVGEVVKRHAPDALFIVDSASAFPGNVLKTDEWGIDVDYFVSHKGFNGPSGLNFMSINEKAWKKFENRKTKPMGWYTSVKSWYDEWVNVPDDNRMCLASFPNPQLHAMRSKLDLMELMGEEKFIKKSEIASRAVRMGIKTMTKPNNKLVIRGPFCEHCPGCEAVDPNLAGVVEAGRYCSQTMFGVKYPPGFPWKKFMDILQDKFWIVAPHFGFGDDRKDGYFYSPNGMRIGFIREDEQIPRNIVSILVATGIGMNECGVKADWKTGVETAMGVLDEYEKIGFTMYKKPETGAHKPPKENM